MKAIETVSTSAERSIGMNKPSLRPSCALPAPGEHTTSSSLQPPQNVNIGSLRQFTHAEILKKIDTRRTSLLLRRFASELGNVGLTIPAAANDQMDDDYFNRWLALLSDPTFPPVITRTLLSIENAALPENAQAVDNAILRCISNIAPGANRLDQVLELWFYAPEELAPFNNPPSTASFDVERLKLSACPDSIGVESSPSLVAVPADPPLSTYQPINLSTPISSSGAALLHDLSSLLRRFVVLPSHAAETLALWILHTYAFKLRDVSTYIGIESPEKGCGKTTLLRVLGKLVHTPVSTANVSPSALFRVIEELQPTLLIDEGDTFLRNHDELRGILNAGYTPDTAFVLRASNESTLSSSDTLRVAPKLPSEGGSSLGNPNALPSSPKTPPLHNSITPSRDSHLSTYQRINLSTPKSGFSRFSTWCPKAIAMIGRLPETLADRCIIIRMQKKSRAEKCDRLRDLDVGDLPARCEAFVKQNADAIAHARPLIPSQLGDRAADIWEPLLLLADLASLPFNPLSQTSSETLSPSMPSNCSSLEVESLKLSVGSSPSVSWSSLARSAAIHLNTVATQSTPIGCLLFDLMVIMARQRPRTKFFTRELLQGLSGFTDRPWAFLLNGKQPTEMWLAQQLRPYGITSRTVWVNGVTAKGYDREDFTETFRRYVPRSALDACYPVREE